MSLFVVVSVALASPLPVQAIQEAREPVVELIVRDVPMNDQIFHREVTADTELGVNLPILAREHESFEDYVQEVCVLPLCSSHARL